MKWLAEKTSRKDVIEIWLAEELLGKMPERLRTWVREKKPTTAREMAVLADEYVRNRSGEADCGKKAGVRPWASATPRESGGEGKVMSTVTVKKEKVEPSQPKPWMLPKFDSENRPRCFHCHEYGHITSVCPQKQKTVLMATGLTIEAGLSCDRGQICGQWVDNIAVDSGATMTLVHSKWIPPALITEERVKIITVNNAEVYLATAEVDVTVRGVTTRLKVGVHNSLGYDALLGLIDRT